MMMAPIIIFAFNRLDSLKNLIISLLNNEESKDSDLFIFVDGARIFKNGEKEKVFAVQEYIKTIVGFKTLTFHFSKVNRGLGESVISGVTEVLKKNDSAIILEDDLIVSSNFLSFMNQGLVRYKEKESVFSICGYTNQIKCPNYYKADSYFCTRSSSWGWATWKNRWESVDWQLNNFQQYKKYSFKFNRWGGSDCWKMLNDWHCEKNSSWAIRFCFNQFLQDKVSLFPIKSLIQNVGFDGEGTNCKKWSRFTSELMPSPQKTFIYPTEICVQKDLYKEAMKYNSLLIRIWSKIMYFIHE